GGEQIRVSATSLSEGLEPWVILRCKQIT
ncbi:hypothetical protein LINPERHAP1_LOCUS39143, partial [Linum perenne]